MNYDVDGLNIEWHGKCNVAGKGIKEQHKICIAYYGWLLKFAD